MKNLSLIICLFLLSSWQVNAQQSEIINDTIQISVSDISLYSILSSPLNSTEIAIIMPGSGPTDHNGNQPGVVNNSIKFLAANLNKNNIATLRFDKRAINNSSYEGFKESDLTIDQYAKDLVQVIEFAKSKNFKKIYLIGHSEGSLISLIALQSIKVDGFISIAGVGQSADLILKNQLKPQLPADFFSQVEIIIDSLKMGYQVKNTPQQLFMLFRPSVQPYLISWFKCNPTELIKNINIPILIINGTKDLQVGIDQAELLHNANSKSTYIEIENMNHVLKTIDGEMQENIQSYTNPELEINSELVNAISNFIKN
jgi:hypothetical protein